MNKNKCSILFLIVMMLTFTVTSINAATTNVSFSNGGNGSVSASRTSVSASAYHINGYPCTSTVEAGFTNGTQITVGPVSGPGLATAARNGLKNVSGARGILLINGERKTAIALV